LILHSIKPRVWRLHERNFLLNLCEQLAITLYQSKIRRELEKTTQYKSYFLSSISHELRTPMNSVIGYSEMLKNGMAGSLNEHQQRYLGNVISSGKHLLNLINEILDISKIESGAMLVKVEEVALRPLLEEIFSSLETLSVSKHLSMTMELLMDRSNLATDALRLRQILLNLVSNAIKFNRPGGQVRVRVSTQSIHGVPHFRFDVQDTGIGISRHDLAHLFGEFYQVDNSYSRQQEGSGLGLHLTKKLVELLGGSIWVQSEVGVGSIFSFALPVSPTAPHMVSNAQSIEP
jgi:signal transduction histidine kinase